MKSCNMLSDTFLCTVLSVIHVVNCADVVDVEKMMLNMRQARLYSTSTISLKTVLSLPPDVDLVKTVTVDTVQGIAKSRHKELFKGKPVTGAGVEACVDNQGNYLQGIVTGTVVLNIENDLPLEQDCNLKPRDAVLLVLGAEGLPDATNIIDKHVADVIFVDDKKIAHRAYEVELFIPELKLQPFYVIDRCSWAILDSFNKMYRFTAPPNPANGPITESPLSLFTIPVVGTQPLPQTIAADTLPVTQTIPTAPRQPVTATNPVPLVTDFRIPTVPPFPTNIPIPNNDPVPTSNPAVYADPLAMTTVGIANISCPTAAVGIGGNTKTKQYSYGVPPRCLNPLVVGDQCFLENQYVKVVDLKGARFVFAPETANFTCSVGYLDAINGAFSPALDAYFFATISGRMYEEWYGLPPVTKKPLVQVHYGNNIDNAFFNPYSNVLTFGDGNYMTFPLVSMDVVSHELAHGITTKHSNLRYKGESGGIDESFSDMAGEVAEAFFQANDWLVGSDLMKNDGEAFRYFDDPTRDGKSIKHVSQFKNRMDVHFSSGIFNHVFYLMSTVYGIDIKYSFEAFLKANQLYWKSNDGFVEAACGTVRAAYDAGIDVVSVIDAFAEVGITACNISTFIEKLDPAVIQENLRVSSIIQPMFRVSIPPLNTGIIIQAYTVPDDVIGILITDSISRDIPELNTALNYMDYILPDNVTNQLYIRLYTYTETVIPNVYLAIKFT